MSRIFVNGIMIETAGPANVSINNGRITINGKNLDGIKDRTNVTIKGDINNLTVDGDAEIDGNVKGYVDAGGNVTCHDVGGDIDCGGNVMAKNAKRNIDAGGNVIVQK